MRNHIRLRKHSHWWLVLLILLFAACTAATPTPTATPTETASSQTSTLDTGNIQLHLQHPTGWTKHNEPGHILISEHETPTNEAGQLNGILFHLWVPSLDDLDIEYDPEHNMALQVLNEIIVSPAYIESAATSQPMPFVWSEHHAAYYTLSYADNSGSVGMVITLVLPDSQQVIAVNISAPADHAARIRELLPDLFNSFTVNDTLLENGALLELPDPLAFPETGSP